MCSVHVRFTASSDRRFFRLLTPRQVAASNAYRLIFRPAAGAHIAEQYDVSLGIFSWEIDFFGRIRSLKDQALEQFLATQQAGRSAQLLMVSAVADAFLVLAGDRENFKLAQTTFETQKSAFDLIKRRFEAGLASRLDLNRAQTQVDAARGDLARYTLLLAQDENRLNLLAGAPTALQAEIMPEGLADIRPFKKIFRRYLLRATVAPA